jgi:hypothetical protein
MPGAGSWTAALTFMFVLLIAGITLATPPDRIRLSINDSTGMLAIAVHHPTFYPAAHQIAKVAVMPNHSVVLLQRKRR